MADRIHTYCALCTGRCGAVASVADDVLVRLDPDPSHPTGRALCPKGRAAPELIDSPRRLRQPLRRTRPKGDPDPGWEPITWDEALDTIASRLGALAAEHGPESVVFTHASPSTSALSDSAVWINRLRHAFGSPNLCLSMELCGWGRYLASQYVYGAAVPGEYMPDLDHAGCILYWGYNPLVARLPHATATIDAINRGARLVVVDPRHVGFASRADHWLQVRPGTDGALALGLANVMIQRGWYDEQFIGDWTNGPLLVRSDTGSLLRAADVPGLAGEAAPVGAGQGQQGYVTWNGVVGAPTRYDAASGRYSDGSVLLGSYDVHTRDAVVPCRTVFESVTALCAAYPPDVVADITGVPADSVVATARTLWESRPTAYYAWSGVEQQTGATQIARAINLLYALTGSFDDRGGNVLFPNPPSLDMNGRDLLPSAQPAKTLGLVECPLGGARFGHATSGDIYRAILDHEPYGVHAIVSFGSNLLLAHADGNRARQALTVLDFHVHADLFLNPTAELADIVLPVASSFETEGLKVGFEISEAARSLIQLRPAVVIPRGEARSDIAIVFDLACRLGLGEHFWHGDIDAAYRAQLAPTGVTLEDLRSHPEGVRVPLETQYRKYAELVDGAPRGFRTPTRKIELHSDVFAGRGYPALPEYEEPLVSPRTRPDLTARFPLILTCAKDKLYLESQGRGLPSLRRRMPDPQVELHPDAAAARGIGQDDWVSIETPTGSVRARARLNPTLAPDVVCGQHGWWESCDEIGAPAFPATGAGSANYNLLIDHLAIDPVSGSVPLRAFLCEVRLEHRQRG